LAAVKGNYQKADELPFAWLVGFWASFALAPGRVYIANSSDGIAGSGAADYGDCDAVVRSDEKC